MKVFIFENVINIYCLEDYRKGINYLKRQLNVAEEAKEHGFIQLALHTLAQNYNSEASRFSDESINLAAVIFELSVWDSPINFLLGNFQ
jgi:hypothetical protein